MARSEDAEEKVEGGILGGDAKNHGDRFLILPAINERSWGSVLLIIFYVENLDVGSWGVKNDV